MLIKMIRKLLQICLTFIVYRLHFWQWKALASYIWLYNYSSDHSTRNVSILSGISQIHADQPWKWQTGRTRSKEIASIRGYAIHWQHKIWNKISTILKNVAPELESIHKEAATSSNEQTVAFTELLKQPFRWPLFIAVMLMFSQQLTGINAAMYVLNKNKISHSTIVIKFAIFRIEKIHKIQWFYI